MSMLLHEMLAADKVAVIVGGGISLKEMIVIGDAMCPGGNDYAAEQAGVIPVRGPEDTKRAMQAITACLAEDIAPDILSTSTRCWQAFRHKRRLRWMPTM
jgi:hypothetical protein